MTAGTADASAPAATGRVASARAVSGGASGTIWFAGWLFTIGFCHLVWWKALLGVVLWPYLLGESLR